MAEQKEPQDTVEPCPPKLGLVSKLLNLVADESNGIVGDVLRFSLLIGTLSLFGQVKDAAYLIYKCDSPFISDESGLDLETCTRLPQFESCSKVVVHHTSQIAFALCGPQGTYSPSWYPILDVWRYTKYAEKETSKLYTYDLKLQNASIQRLGGDYSGLKLNFNSLGVSQEEVDGKVLLALGSTQDQSSEAALLLQYDIKETRVVLVKTLMFHDLGLVEKILPVSTDAYYIALSPKFLGWKGRLHSIIYSSEGISLLCDEFGCTTISTEAGASGLAVDVKGEKVYLAGRYSTELSVGLHNIARNSFEQSLPTGLALINQGWDPVSKSGFAIGTPRPFPLSFGVQGGLPIKVLLFKPKTSGIVNLNSGPPPYTTEVIYHKHIVERFGDVYLDLSTKSLFLASHFIGNSGLYMCKF